MPSHVVSQSANAVIAQARLDIEDGSPVRRQAAVTQWVGRLQSLREPLSDRLTAIAAEYRNAREAWTGAVLPNDATPHAEQGERHVAMQYRIGGWTAVAVEILLTIFVSVTTLSLFWVIAGLVGIVVAVLLALLVESFLTTRWNSELPRASVRSLFRWTNLAFWVSFAGIGLLLLTRTIPLLAPVTDVGLAVLSLSLPLLAGSLFVLAFIHDRFNGLEQEYRQVRLQLSELDGLIKQLRLLGPSRSA